MGLTLTTDLAYGNAALVEITTTDQAYNVAFTPDAHGGLERLWFCFRLQHDAVTAPRRMINLKLKHFESVLGGGGDGRRIRPVIRYEGQAWQRLPEPSLAPTPDGRMSLGWQLNTPATFADVALCYPYGLPEIEVLLAESAGYWRQDEIGVSQGGNPLWRLSNDYGTENAQVTGLYLMARQHSGEVGGSWVLDGLLRRLAELKPQNLLVWCCPLTNIDGVLNGDYGKNPFPHDLNRAWSPSGAMRHEVGVIIRDLKRWKQRSIPALVVDFHCPSCTESDGVYTFVMPDEENQPQYTEPLHVYKDSLGHYAADQFIKCSHYKAKSVWGQFPMLREYISSQFQIEASSFEIPYSLINDHVLEIADYRDIGRRLADAIVTMLRLEPSC